ncbi:GNAT family N-acetyltransferase [Azospirillum sp. SYSU D00513]|uniref:GNAT family N-acetyltransferase n=1 Tax=Azospirillum sp. SYSU D00513 TaxID=2812561 RepID=UPI001A959ED6|nr:GNAT family N-acetyltransferase [Azospirillum sp. SYSU D00513]
MTVMPWTQRGIARYVPDDRPDLESFQREYFGPNSIQLCRDHFRWLLEPPEQDPEGPQFWVCRRNGGIVGQQAGIPFALKAGDRSHRASWAIDLMVAKEWRLRGVGPTLSDAHLASSEVSISLGMTDAAYKSYKRAGWSDLGGLPTFLRVIDPLRCLRVSPYGGALASIAAGIGKPALSVASTSYNLAARVRGGRLVEVPAFDEKADELWEAAAPQHTVIARRDRAFLSWRFDRAPNAGRLRRFYIMKGGRLMGYVVLRVDRWRGEPVAVVLDYLARPGWLMPTFALVVEQARRERVSALLCRTLNMQAARPLSMMGFLCLRNGLRAPTRMMVRPAPDRQELGPMLADPRNWFVTTADSDIGFTELGG